MMNPVTQPKPERTCLGMRLSELSRKDLAEERSDISRDLNAILDCEAGFITPTELQRECSFGLKDKQLLINALALLDEEIKERNSKL